jgi:hypothetical protein
MTKLQMLLVDLILERRSSITEDAFIAVIGATGNVDVALEMFTGVYVPPVIESSSPKNYIPYKSAEVIFAGPYDPFKDELTVCYQERENRYAYVKRGTSPTLFEVADECFDSKTTVAFSLGLSPEEFEAQYEQKRVYGNLQEKVQTATTSLKNWQ